MRARRAHHCLWVPQTVSGPSPRRDPGYPGRAQSGRPLRCPSGTPHVSHGRVSDTFPVCYAARTVQMPAHRLVSAIFRSDLNQDPSRPIRRRPGVRGPAPGQGLAASGTTGPDHGRCRRQHRRAWATSHGPGGFTRHVTQCHGQVTVVIKLQSGLETAPAVVYAQAISSGKRLPHHDGPPRSAGSPPVEPAR